jgi:hypothetical protein
MHGTPPSPSTLFWRQTGFVGAAAGASLLFLYFGDKVVGEPRDATVNERLPSINGLRGY